MSWSLQKELELLRAPRDSRSPSPSGVSTPIHFVQPLLVHFSWGKTWGPVGGCAVGVRSGPPDGTIEGVPPGLTFGDKVTTVEGRKEMFYLTMHSAHFIYGYMALDIW